MQLNSDNRSMYMTTSLAQPHSTTQYMYRLAVSTAGASMPMQFRSCWTWQSFVWSSVNNMAASASELRSCLSLHQGCSRLFSSMAKPLMSLCLVSAGRPSAAAITAGTCGAILSLSASNQVNIACTALTCMVGSVSALALAFGVMQPTMSRYQQSNATLLKLQMLLCRPVASSMMMDTQHIST